ncbi:UDP-3-O-(3-hydroxymyristoyl)glucosamine N-acyltransferase [uncultured Microbulbifer sp.]|uniref:UDP-3-O-(3-hydroxymyristoyl)glucosamine N-acyltransferase n=1 Tax=uncultured Microbulbifer sp. TaxID=348147 RepID=UPI00261C601D|nr:UDP-3-O-(3-hydroxymyristoyl)glucosamine N-acyltransferase [uncultured Microbulbifer sp.]
MSLAQLALELGAELRLAPGVDAAHEISGLCTLQDGKPDQLTFLANPNYRRFLKTTSAGAVLVTAEFADGCPVSALCVDNPYLAFAKASALFNTAPLVEVGVHPSAVIHPDAEVDPSASIAAGAVVEAFAKIGPRASVGANCFVGEGSTLGEGSCLYAGAILHHGCQVGRDAIIHSHAVIGADGFGFALHQREWIKIYQLGGVQVGDEVEVGANTCVDRGALGDTVIGRGVKIDNLVQIAHNVQIGDYSAIAACTGIAGSAIVGKHCALGGSSRIAGHVTIADGCQVTANTFVTKSIDSPGVYSGGLPFADSQSWRRNAVRFGQLDKMARRLKDLEKQLAMLSCTKDE